MVVTKKYRTFAAVRRIEMGTSLVPFLVEKLEDMIKKETIKTLIDSKLAETNYFLVDFVITPDNIIRIEIDSEDGVDIEFCVQLSRFIEENLDREVEDFELEVGSAGLTTPFKVLRQYKKNIGNIVEVLENGGMKYNGTLISADDEGFAIQIVKMERREGDKRKKEYSEELSYKYSDVKSVKYNNF